MPFPTTDRLKNLVEIVDGMGVEPWGSHPFQPNLLPGVIVGFIDRSDSGKCLKVVPFQVKAVTDQGDVTFNDGTSLIPSTINFYVKVYPFDVEPSSVASSFTVGDAIWFFPYWAAGDLADKVRGTYICTGASASLPAPEFTGQILTGIDNAPVWLLDVFVPALPG